MYKQAFIAVATASFVVSASSAAMIGVAGPFIGQVSEGFEDLGRVSRSEPLRVFDASAIAFVGATRAPNVTGGWGFGSANGRSSVRPHEGGRFAGGIGGAVEYEFDQDVYRFGGWFAGNTIAENGTAEFYASDGTLLGERAISAPSPGDGGVAEWIWNGWEFDQGVSRIVLGSNYGSGAYLLQDDLQADFSRGSIPAPGPAFIYTIGLSLSVRRRRPA